MKALILPIALTLGGVGAGSAAGYFLRPSASAPAGHAPDQAADHATDHTAPEAQEHAPHAEDQHGSDTLAEAQYYKFQQQFIIPVVKDGKMSRMVLMGLGLETSPATRDRISSLEPKLRDALLRTMFDHATLGGFDGNFTEHGPMEQLEEQMLLATQDILGPGVTDVLILEIARQDLD